LIWIEWFRLRCQIQEKTRSGFICPAQEFNQVEFSVGLIGELEG
jgi:hypothetical protein